MSTNEQEQTFIFNLPQDIIFDILSRLPTRSLIQFRCVCASSPPLISHPSFIKLHLSSTSSADITHLLIYYESTDYINQFYSLRSLVTFQETLKLEVPYKTLHGYLRIVGSSKGLICFYDTNYYSNVGKVVLWNPSISRFVKVNDPFHDFDNVSHFVVGFGFVSRELVFKVVKIVYYLEKEKCDVCSDVFVYEVVRNVWRKKEGVVAPCYMVSGWSSNVVVNGFVNWLGWMEVVRGGRVPDVIMSFNLDNECFDVLEFPRNVEGGYDQVCLVSYGDSLLSLGAHYVELDGERWDMWVMGEYGVVDSWKKVCVVMQTVLSIPPLLMRNDHEVLMVMNDGRLVLFDAIKNEMLDLETCGLPRAFNAIGYTASLALLQG